MSRPIRPSTAAVARESGLDSIPVTLVGHPYAPIGMGEQLRSHLSACRAVHVDAKVFDVFRFASRSDPHHGRLVDGSESDGLSDGIRIFHVNADEIDPVLARLAALKTRFSGGYNVIVPAWELPTYPATWAAQLARFDEVWALSTFIQGSLARAGVSSHLVGQSVAPLGGALLPRRYFGLSESAFILLTMFDLSSYARRKNPEAVLALFDQLCAEQPLRDLQLVVKVKDGEQPGTSWARRLQRPGITVLDQPMASLEVRSLLNACDVFVSLHRAEGFGRGLGEAMALGRLALGTGWSGNLDFMTPANSLLVQNHLVRIRANQYPHGKGQVWAEPDVEHAATLLRPVLDDPARGRDMARRGQADVLLTHGDRAVGLRILDRLQAIAAALALRSVLQAARVRRRTGLHAGAMV